MSRQYAQPLICDARMRTRWRSLSSSPPLLTCFSRPSIAWIMPGFTFMRLIRAFIMFLASVDQDDSGKKIVTDAIAKLLSRARSGPALGFPQGAALREAYAVFGDGDGLVLFTDGVSEVGPSPDEFFDVEGVQATVRQLWSRDAAAICDGY